jgi:acyl-CoA synthetase (AMP-forming)/AMP-acid ligase II
VSDWNLAEVWEAVAGLRPEAPAQSCGERRTTWAEFDARADGVAAGLLAAGLGHQSKVAQYLYSVPEYLESLFGAVKAGMVPVNTNYRYTADELEYLWSNADAEAVIFGGSFGDRVEEVRPRLPAVRVWVWVDDGGAGCPPWATPYEEWAGAGEPGRGTAGPWGRSGDDLILIYTGGTTGMPKGVMWRQDDLFAVLNRTGGVRYPEEGGVDDVAAILSGPLPHPPARLVPCAPLMHGTGLFTAISVLCCAGSIVLLQGRHYSATELLDTIQRERVTEASIVGDAFARPLLAELDAHPGGWDLSSLWLMISSGVMWSAEVKGGLLRHQPRLTMVDTLGSSEAIGLARSATSRKGTAATAGFQLGSHTRVVTEDGREIVPGSGEVGMVAIRGRTSLGYYKDPAKTATTFRVIDGDRWSIPGDWATVEADGTVRLLGRGSVVINTGGEKVFPEEVEEVLKQHPTVADAVVVGVPHERFGEAVVCLAEAAPGRAVDEQELIAWVRGKLAAYKAPRRVVPVATIGRAANGKVDYRRLKAEATAAMAP